MIKQGKHSCILSDDDLAGLPTNNLFTERDFSNFAALLKLHNTVTKTSRQRKGGVQTITRKQPQEILATTIQSKLQQSIKQNDYTKVFSKPVKDAEVHVPHKRSMKLFYKLNQTCKKGFLKSN